MNWQTKNLVCLAGLQEPAKLKNLENQQQKIGREEIECFGHCVRGFPCHKRREKNNGQKHLYNGEAKKDIVGFIVSSRHGEHYNKVNSQNQGPVEQIDGPKREIKFFFGKISREQKTVQRIKDKAVDRPFKKELNQLSLHPRPSFLKTL